MRILVSNLGQTLYMKRLRLLIVFQNTTFLKGAQKHDWPEPGLATDSGKYG